MNSTINIIISNQEGVGNESNPEMPGATPNAESPETTKKQGKEKSNALTITKALALNVGKKSLDMAVSRVGAVTRSNIKQQKVNAAMKMATTGIGFIGSVATGNFAAAALLGISTVFDFVGSAIEYNHNRGIESTALSIQQTRAGINRSR